jgi:glycosyltransferase involved in cell wall biosynthesis
MDFTLTDIGTEGGLIHYKSLAKAMDALYKDKNLYSFLSKRGLDKFNKKELSWPHIASIWNEVFLEAANIHDDNIPGNESTD